MGRARRAAALTAPLRHREFRLLWFAQIASEFGDWSARLAVAVLVLQRTDSPALSALSLTISLLPTIVVGPYLATFGDRRPRRTLLVLMDVSRAAVFLLMAFPLPTWTLFPLLFVGSTATPPFEAARSALMPSTVPSDVYSQAVVLAGTTMQCAILTGYAFGGGLIAIVGARGSLAVNAATFLFSAACLSALKVGRETPGVERTAGESLTEGIKFVLSDPIVRRTTLLICIVSLGAIVSEVLAPAYAREVLHEGAGTAGLLAAAVPLGTVLASVATHHVPEGARAVTRIGLLALVSAAASAGAFALDFAMPWIVVPFLGVGVVFASVMVGNVVLGTRIPDHVRSSAFGLLQAAVITAQAVGALLGGLLAQFVGVRAACLAGLLAVGAGALWTLAGHTARSG
jgi:predicted MFS family arabinose efflux permease